MKYLILIVLFVSSCINVAEKEFNSNINYYKDSLQNGMLITYEQRNDSVLLIVKRGEFENKLYFNSLISMSDINNCSLYKLDWWNDSILIASKECGVAFGKESYVYSFHEDSIVRFIYEEIIHFDKSGIGAYANESYDVIVVDFYTSIELGRFNLLSYTTLEEIENASPNLLEELDPKFLNKERRERFLFSNDTIFFKFLEKDTFYILNTG